MVPKSAVLVASSACSYKTRSPVLRLPVSTPTRIAHVSQSSLPMESGDKEIAFEKDSVNAELEVSKIDERKLVRKIDLHLIPWLSLLYLLSFLDRTSIGNAKVVLYYLLSD